VAPAEVGGEEQGDTDSEQHYESLERVRDLDGWDQDQQDQLDSWLVEVVLDKASSALVLDLQA